MVDESFKNILNPSHIEFVAKVAHDLKAPLNAIVGFSSMLQNDLTGLEENQFKQLQLIYQSARKLEDRINSILEFINMVARKTKVEDEWIDIKAFLGFEIEQLQDSARQQGCDLVLKVQKDLLEVFVKPKLFSRVVHELLTNAINNTKNGTVTVEALGDSIPDDDGYRLEIAVLDTGSGLSEVQMGKISQSLAAQDDDAMQRFAGLGLGLGLARRAAWDLGCKLKVQPNNNHQSGACFTFVMDLDNKEIRK